MSAHMSLEIEKEQNMKLYLSSIVALCCLVSSTLAVPIQIMEGEWNGSTLVRRTVDGGFNNRSFGFHSYDNWRWLCEFDRCH